MSQLSIRDDKPTIPNTPNSNADTTVPNSPIDLREPSRNESKIHNSSSKLNDEQPKVSEFETPDLIKLKESEIVS